MDKHVPQMVIGLKWNAMEYKVKHKSKQSHGRQDQENNATKTKNPSYTLIGWANARSHWHVRKIVGNIEYVCFPCQKRSKQQKDIKHGKSKSYRKFKNILPKNPLVCPFRKGFPHQILLGMGFSDHQSYSIGRGLDFYQQQLRVYL